MFLAPIYPKEASTIHKGTGQIMVKVISKQDGKIIREVPSEELLNVVAKIDKMIGILFYGKA